MCRLDGRPLVLVNTRYRVLAIATGPATPPQRLGVSLAFVIEDESVTEMLPAGYDQPNMHTLATKSTSDTDTARERGTGSGVNS